MSEEYVIAPLLDVVQMGGVEDSSPKKQSSRVGIEYIRWTKEEEEKLLSIVAASKGKNWSEIARAMDNGRTNKACNHKYQDLIKGISMKARNEYQGGDINLNMDGYMHDSYADMASSTSIKLNDIQMIDNAFNDEPERVQVVSSATRWSADEDKILIRFVADTITFPHVPWAKLHVEGRSKKACSNRWDYIMKNKLAPQELLDAFAMKATNPIGSSNLMNNLLNHHVLLQEDGYVGAEMSMDGKRGTKRPIEGVV